MAALLTLLSANAQPISEQEALVKAQQFFSKASLSSATRGRAPRKTPEPKLANNRSEFFAFNDEANGGYVVVSGDERMPDVLAYSYDGHFDADNMPCNMKAWMKEYAEQVKYLRAHPEAKMTKRSATERENVGPLLTCWFDQSYPYNKKCPNFGGTYTLTGCVATAMAQVMYYWQWPKQTTDIIPGYDDMPAQPITTIDWDNMLNKYDYEGTYTEEQIDAVSTLMLLCGTSVTMDYGFFSSMPRYIVGPDSSLPQYFDYDDMIEVVSRENYDNEEWEQIMYEELKSKRPIIYTGRSKEDGHAFVMDGYADGYFHVNWGWGGAESYVLMTDDKDWYGYVNNHNAAIGIQPAYPDIPRRYAVLENGKMTLYYDKEMNHRSGTVLLKDQWKYYAEEITECIIDPSFADLKQRDLRGFFEDLNKMKSISGIENLNTSEATDMSYMFDFCYNLTSLDVSGFKTDKVTTMRSMFSGCKSLTSLDVSGFKTDKVTNMMLMFYNCSSLTSLDVSGFKTDNVVFMGDMFHNCKSLTSLDVSGFKTDNVHYMGELFSGCSNLTSLDVSGFKTDNVKDMEMMFAHCSSLTNLDVSGFKTDSVTNMGEMFWGCSSLTSLNVSGFKTDNVTNMKGMFSGCKSLTSLDVSGFKTDKVADMSGMFAFCSSLTSLDVSGFKTDNMTDMGSLFRSCSGLTSLDLSGFKTEKVTNMEGLFYNCSGLTNLDLSGFKTDNVTDMGYMFGYCSSLTNLDLSGFKTDKVERLFSMFSGCSALKSLDLSGFKTSNVTSMGWMFYDCQQLSTIYVSERWDMSNISDAEATDHMFGNCYSIIGSAGTTYDANHIDGEYARIDKGSVAPGYFTEKVPQYYTITYMLNGEEYMSQYFKVGAAITAIEDPIIEGYTFVEWNDEIPEIMPAHDVVITGTLTANKYTITYIIEGEVFMIDSLAYGSTIIFPEVPEREGYTIHWYWDGQIMPAYDITIWGTYVSGIGTLYMKDEDEKWFTIEGKRTETPRKGLNIVHTSKGIKKVVVK